MNHDTIEMLEEEISELIKTNRKSNLRINQLKTRKIELQYKYDKIINWLSTTRMICPPLYTPCPGPNTDCKKCLDEWASE